MKFSCLLPLLAFAAHASASELQLRGRQLAQCNALDEAFANGGSGVLLDETRTSADIFVPFGGTMKCVVSCSARSGLKLYMKFGGGNIDAATNNGANENMNCGEALTARQTDSAATSGFSYRIIADSYAGISVNCDCPDESSPIADGGFGCFSGVDTLQVLNKGEVTMEDLEIGDSVLVSAGKYEPVYSFGHKDTSSSMDFVQIHSNGISKPLELTGDHMVYVNGYPVRADSVKPGDMITADAAAHAVTKISSVNRKGLYMPITASGKIVVNGVLASNYVSVMDVVPGVLNHPLLFWLSEHNMHHMWMAPVRMLCFGVSSSFCEGTHTEDGILQWLWNGKAALEYTESKGAVATVLIGFIAIGSLVAINLVEFVFGAAFAPLALVLIAGLAIRRNKMAQQLNQPGSAIKTKAL